MIWSEKVYPYYKNRRYLLQAVGGILVHLAALLSIPLVLPTLTFGSVFMVSSIITAGLVALGSYVFAVMSASGLLDRVKPSSLDAMRTERLVHLVFGLAVGLWVFLPLTLQLFAATTGFSFLSLPLMLSFLVYVVAVILLSVEISERNR